MLHNEKKKLIFSAYPSSPVSYGQEILREERITLQNAKRIFKSVISWFSINEPEGERSWFQNTIKLLSILLMLLRVVFGQSQEVIFNWKGQMFILGFINVRVT